MSGIKQVLLATDFSEASEHALELAQTFASSFGATLHLVHVIPDPYAQPWSVEATGSAIPDLLKKWETEAGARLEELKPAGIEGQTVVRVGNPFHEIVEYAKEQGIDLIVIGTHGRGAIGHMLLGSVAEKVVRKAPCPVLTARHPKHAAEGE